MKLDYERDRETLLLALSKVQLVWSLETSAKTFDMQKHITELAARVKGAELDDPPTPAELDPEDGA